MQIINRLKISLVLCCFLAGVSCITGIIFCIVLSSQQEIEDIEYYGHDTNADGLVSGILLAILSIGLIGSFLYLNRKLNKHFQDDLVEERRLMRDMFFLFMACYTLRTFYQFIYYDFAHTRVCSFMVRNMLNILMPLAWEIVPNVTIMYWHHENFKTVNFLDRLKHMFCCCSCLRRIEQKDLSPLEIT